MGDYILFFIMILAFIAIFLRADFILTLIYLFVAVLAVGRWWSRRAIHSLSARREYTRRAFWGEKVPVSLVVKNSGWLPVVWLQIHESLPVELTVPGFFRHVVSLGAGSEAQFHYLLEGRKRGYYQLGPLAMQSGDIFGITEKFSFTLPADSLIVYPKIVPLVKVKLPSRSPLGTLRHHQPIFEDPTRVLGKRDYVAGDSLRRMDWKATAASGRLQVKLFEPSIAMETAILLNLNTSEYDHRNRYDATELGIVVAASLANWVIGLRQAAGLATNGLDPFRRDEAGSDAHWVQPVPIRRGRGHLMRILDVLARVQPGMSYPFVLLLQRQVVHLPWGTTLLLITSNLNESLFDGLFQAQRAGLNVVLLPCGTVAGFEQIRRRAEYFGFPIYQILDERDLDIWRQ